MGKTVKLNELLEIVKNLKQENKKIVTTNGCFDILHVGHVRYLQKAKELGDILIVGVNTDSSVKKLKGPTRPINNENDRAEVLAALGCVDFTVLFSEDTPVKLLSEIKPDVHTKGGDYDVNNLPEAKVVQDNGGKLVFIDFVDGKSTTNIINKAKL